MSITKYVFRHYDQITSEYTRYKSWEYCYSYFRKRNIDKDTAALHLAFYLASWGMYRGSGFLLQNDYKIHEPAVDLLLKKNNSSLWISDNENSFTEKYVDSLCGLKKEIQNAYGNNNCSDTLITKILLGTLGTTPAYDRYFRSGAKLVIGKAHSFNKKSYSSIISFCNSNIDEIRRVQKRIKSKQGIKYPIMKIVDMYFWQLGYEMEQKAGK